MNIKLPHILFLFLLSVLSTEPLLLFYAGALLLYILKYFWRTHEPKHLLVNLLLYWAVVAILIPYAELSSKPLIELSKYGQSDIRLASWLGLIGLTFYLLGIQSMTSALQIVSLEKLNSILEKYNGRRIIIIYIIVSLLTAVLGSSIIHIPGAQLLLSIGYMKWVL